MTTSATTLSDLVHARVLDAELAALCWLLVEGGVPVVVTGGAEASERRRIRAALLRLPPDASCSTFDAEQGTLTLGGLGEAFQRGHRVGIVAAGSDLRQMVELLTGPAEGLPEDAVRRLGLVLVVGLVPSVAPGAVIDRVRVLAAHYLRPLERDGQGHVQRRPPAVLATWDPAADVFDHFAWGVVGELADRVDRSRPSFEALQADRAAGLAALAQGSPAATTLEAILAAEPPREPAPLREAAVPTPLRSPLTDPPQHTH
ncbi:MAG: hypothetical protein U0667_10300 [Chloroflexota bacterium]